MSNTGATNKRIGELIGDVLEKKLIIRPHFQRRLVWNNEVKERFIDTVLKGYPFPEIFIAEGKREGKAIRRETWLVDGQQRVSTLISYYEGSEDLLYKTIPRYADLEEDVRTQFLDYFVAVRDLGAVSNETIIEIFDRINSTDYALKSMELLHAMYSGRYKGFCEELSRDPFFERHNVFPEAYKRRMYDVAFCVILVTTLLSGYYKRDERNEEYLERYDEDFPEMDSVRIALDRVFDFVERCDFQRKTRAWKQTDLFTLLVELHVAMLVDKLDLDPTAVGARLGAFYEQVDRLYAGNKLPDESDIPEGSETVFSYLKAATKATNDKYARVERARIIAAILRDNAAVPPDAVPVETAPSDAAPEKPRRSRGPRKKKPKDES